MVNQVRRVTYAALLACGLAAGCGDDSGVPIEQISKDKPLVGLSSDEQKGACNWVTGLAHEKLMSPLDCHGIPVNVSSCSFPSAAQARCVATVGQWEACMPGFLDAIGADPCKVLDLAFSQTELESFVNAIPGCEGLGPCAYTVMMP